MDLGSLEATFEAHRLPVLAAAGAGVVGLALMKKKKAAADPSAGSADGSMTTTGDFTMPYSAGGQMVGSSGGAAYDSSASDLYGALQPQLESLGSQNTDLKNQNNTLTQTLQQLQQQAGQLADKVTDLQNRPAQTIIQQAPTPVPAAPAWTPPPQPAPQYVAPAPSFAVDTWYTVQRGDTLSGIAARFPQQGITAGSIGQANGIANLNKIQTGQRLHIFGN